MGKWYDFRPFMAWHSLKASNVYGVDSSAESHYIQYGRLGE